MSEELKELKVAVLSDVDTETFERLEDDIRDLLERSGLKGIIEDSMTGNTTRTRHGMIGKSEKGLLIEDFGKTDLKNILYKEIIQITEPLEHKWLYKGNGHHLAQQIVEKVTDVIWERNIK